MNPVVLIFVMAFAADLAGIVLLVFESREAGKSLAGYLALNPEGHPGGSCGQVADLQPVIVGLLGSSARRYVGVGLLVVGVAVGFAGNLASLS